MIFSITSGSSMQAASRTELPQAGGVSIPKALWMRRLYAELQNLILFH